VIVVSALVLNEGIALSIERRALRRASAPR
jgi:hypothetical protein